MPLTGLVVGSDFAEKASHGAGHFPIRQKGALDDGPFGVVGLKAGGGDFSDFVFVGTNDISETETARL